MIAPGSPRRVTRKLATAATAVFVAAVTLGPSACGSNSDHHPAGIDGAGASFAGSSGSSPSGEAGEASSLAGEAGSGQAAGGSAGAGNAGSENEAGSGSTPPIPDSLCSEMAAWSGATSVATVSTPADEALLSLTPDELDLAFTRAGALYVAHRADPTGTFVTGPAIAIADGWSMAQGVALSADGKRLVFLSNDQTMLGEMRRTTRDATFAGSVDKTAFATINQTSMYSGNVYASPVLSPDDQQLYLNSMSGGGASTIVASTRSGAQPWSAPTRVIAELDGAAGERRLPTGISADERTLFYFNEGTMKEEARWRSSSALSSSLYDMVDLGTRRGAQPNTACDKLYSQSMGDVIVEHD